MSDHDHGFMIG